MQDLYDLRTSVVYLYTYELLARINWLSVSAVRWQHKSQMCFETFI
jgi:hypothetical protein